MNKEASNEVSAYESESITLCAVVNWKTANVRWLKDGQLLDKENIHLSSEGKTHKLTINPLQLTDSGEYVCDVNTDEMYFSLSVKGKNTPPFDFKVIIYSTSCKTAQEPFPILRNDGEVYQTAGEHCMRERQQSYITM